MDCLILLEKAEIPDGLDESTDSIVRVSSIVMRKISGLQSTDSIDAIGLMKIPSSFLNLDDTRSHCQKWFPSAHRILVLDGIQVTFNAIFRFNRICQGNFCIILQLYISQLKGGTPIFIWLLFVQCCSILQNVQLQLLLSREQVRWRRIKQSEVQEDLEK